ncbi:extracellular solute-binding protein [Rhizocola hellebori]|uniref:extracellular solute-binding protein n=1 Tax=Rhizocola hellebori TaxID=1392758 RepID=UPI001944EB30|nr:extracellular solute-binding protein [Rhizocola hellebori]
MSKIEQQDASSSSENELSPRDLIHSLVVAGAVVAGALASGWPERPIQWLLLVVAAILGGLAPHTRLIVRIRLRGLKVLRPVRPYRLRLVLLGILALVVAAGSGRLLVAATEFGELVILSGADYGLGGQRQALIDQWNSLPDRPHARIVSVPGNADDQHGAMLDAAQRGGRGVDIYNLDNPFMAEFVDAGYLRALDSIKLDLNAFLRGPLETCRRHSKWWGLPLNTDAGLLFYRNDLIGGDPAFRNWADLTTAVEEVFAHEQVLAGAGLNHRELEAGYVGQFASYEGLTVNTLEAIWAAGGEVVDAKGNLVIDDPEMRPKVQAALDSLVAGLSGRHPRVILPPADSYAESSATQAFRDGRAIFLRNWPIAYFELTRPPGMAKPFAVTELPGPSVLGGQNLAVAAHSDQPQAALELIRFLTSDFSQRLLFERGGFAPTRVSVFADTNLGQRYPYLRTLRLAVERARPRPQTPYYARFSEKFRTGILYALQNNGKLPDQFATDLEAVLRDGS